MSPKVHERIIDSVGVSLETQRADHLFVIAQCGTRTIKVALERREAIRLAHEILVWVYMNTAKED